MTDGHDHGWAGSRHGRSLAWALALVAATFLVEVVTALAVNSLALLSDAGHVLTDATGLGMALAAIHLAGRAREQPQRTFGLYRLEILAALANAVLLLGVAGYVVWNGIHRLGDPPEVSSGPMLVVAVIGLAGNLAAFALLRRGARESLNVEAAYLEVLSDAFGSVGVIVAAVVLETTGWAYVDPIVALAIGLFVVPRTWRLGSRAVRILVQAAPPHIDLAAMRADLAAVAGVVDVHDLHVWTLTSAMEVASAHLMVAAGTDTHGVLDQARHVLHHRYRVDHATLQVEPDNHQGCDEISW